MQLSTFLLTCTSMLAALPAMSGEIVDGAFVGKQNGEIRVPLAAGRWQATDTERSAPTAVVSLRLATPIGGTHPVCDVTSAPGMGASAEHVEVAELIAKGMRDKGMDLGPAELRQYNGRQVIRYSTVLNSQGGSAKGDAFILRGARDYFFVTCSANAAIYERVRDVFEDLVETIRY